MDARMSTDVVERERELVITRIFDAPRRLVFQAWTEADRVARWWGPQPASGWSPAWCFRRSVAKLQHLPVGG